MLLPDISLFAFAELAPVQVFQIADQVNDVVARRGAVHFFDE